MAELTRLGIRAGKPENMIAAVSSYLSADKVRFDNVRGQGYGLKEWNKVSLPEAPPPPSVMHSAAANGHTSPDWKDVL